jgi:hypothetical protein
MKFQRTLISDQAWWCMPVIPEHVRLKHEDHKFEDSLGCIVIFGPAWVLHSEMLSQKTTTKKKTGDGDLAPVVKCLCSSPNTANTAPKTKKTEKQKKKNEERNLI